MPIQDYGNYKFISTYSLLHAISVLEVLESTLEKSCIALIVVDNLSPIFIAQRVPDDPLIVTFIRQLKYLAEARLAAIVLFHAETIISKTVTKREVHRSMTV